MENKKLLDRKTNEATRIYTIPNTLSLIRICVTPYIGYLVAIEQFLPACILFSIAGTTDLIDGWIARNYPTQRSILGSVLDPVADKFLISTLFITLSYANLIPVLVVLTAIVLLRDTLLIVGGFVRRYQILEPPFTIQRFFNLSVSSFRVNPSLTSKMNTVLQLLLVTFSLGSPVFGYENHLVLSSLCFTTIFSGFQYASGSAMSPIKRRILSLKPKY